METSIHKRRLIVTAFTRDAYWQCPQPDPGSYQWRAPGTFISVTERENRAPVALLKVEFFDSPDTIGLTEAITGLVAGMYAETGAAVTVQ